jgi:ABC-type branched-subunit amino acid transport system permease subunit
MFFAILFGYVTTKKSGTTFAMITLGIGELVASMALMFPASSAARAASPPTACTARRSSGSPSGRRSRCTT